MLTGTDYRSFSENGFIVVHGFIGTDELGRMVRIYDQLPRAETTLLFDEQLVVKPPPVLR